LACACSLLETIFSVALSHPPSVFSLGPPPPPSTPFPYTTLFRSVLLSELFPAEMRYSGVAIGANIAGAISGLLPFLATWMNSANEQPSSIPGIVILIIVALITAVGGFVGEKYRVKDNVVRQEA